MSYCSKNLAFHFSLFRFVSLPTVLLLTEKLGLVLDSSVCSANKVMSFMTEYSVHVRQIKKKKVKKNPWTHNLK